MLRQCLTLAFLFASASALAQGRKGLDDNGNCVAPCTRAGGMPCRPCLPRIGPGDDEWSVEVAQFGRESEAFRLSIRQRADSDAAYRLSRQYREDRRAAAQLQDTMKALSALTRLTNSQ